MPWFQARWMCSKYAIRLILMQAHTHLLPLTQAVACLHASSSDFDCLIKKNHETPWWDTCPRGNEWEWCGKVQPGYPLDRKGTCSSPWQNIPFPRLTRGFLIALDTHTTSSFSYSKDTAQCSSIAIPSWFKVMVHFFLQELQEWHPCFILLTFINGLILILAWGSHFLLWPFQHDILA